MTLAICNKTLNRNGFEGFRSNNGISGYASIEKARSDLTACDFVLSSPSTPHDIKHKHKTGFRYALAPLQIIRTAQWFVGYTLTLSNSTPCSIRLSLAQCRCRFICQDIITWLFTSKVTRSTPAPITVALGPECLLFDFMNRWTWGRLDVEPTCSNETQA